MDIRAGTTIMGSPKKLIEQITRFGTRFGLNLKNGSYQQGFIRTCHAGHFDFMLDEPGNLKKLIQVKYEDLDFRNVRILDVEGGFFKNACWNGSRNVWVLTKVKSPCSKCAERVRAQVDSPTPVGGVGCLASLIGWIGGCGLVSGDKFGLYFFLTTVVIIIFILWSASLFMDAFWICDGCGQKTPRKLTLTDVFKTAQVPKTDNL